MMTSVYGTFSLERFAYLYKLNQLMISLGIYGRLQGQPRDNFVLN